MDAVRTIYLGDKLPTIYEVVMQIYDGRRSLNIDQNKDLIRRYAAALQIIWTKSFGENHTITMRGIILYIEEILRAYQNKILSHYKKNKGSMVLMRRINKEWRREHFHSKNKRGRKSALDGLCHNDLFDIGKDMDDFKKDSDEAKFYKDQQTTRDGRLSEHIDIEYESEVQAIIDYENEIEEFTNPKEYQEITPLKNRQFVAQSSPKTPRVSSAKTQTDPISERPEIRGHRNYFTKVKDAICTVSYKAAISIEKARMAVQATCSILYGHKYYLTPLEQSNNEPSLESNDEVNEEQVSSSLEPITKKPRTINEYLQYKYVLPSRKVVESFKHNKAIRQEVLAAESLVEKKKDTKITLHYDSTTRSKIDGEWPSLILNFLSDQKEDCKMYILRSLFFAYENRDQIANLIVETFSRLSTALENEVHPSKLWEKVDAFMTDAATKNLAVEIKVADLLNTTHLPHHILCKSHTCEKLDEACINVLFRIEQKINLSSLILQSEPRLKPFIRQSRTVIMSAIKGILQLISYDASAKPTSLAKEFDLILEESNMAKSFSLYKERRFGKQGYTAGSILECVPQLRQLLDRVNSNNLLARACRIYLENDYCFYYNSIKGTLELHLLCYNAFSELCRKK